MTKDELQTVEVICAIGDAAVRELEFVQWQPGDSPVAECHYEDNPEDRRAELEAGVRYILEHPATPLSAQHDAWRARNAHRLKPDDPRLKPFDELPFGMQLKARLWRHIVHAVVG